jgi:tetratricopeptide (TPR) repeat protein
VGRNESTSLLRGDLGALARVVGPEEPRLGTAAADPGEALRVELLGPTREVMGCPTPFVGRREALERVYNGVRDAVRGERLGVIAVTGAPGLGKTRLLAEALAIIDPAGRGIGVWPVLAVASDDADTILAKLVRRRFGISPLERDQDAWDRIIAIVGAEADPRRFGTTVRGLGFLAGLRASGPDALSPAQDLHGFRRVAARAFTELLRADLARTPQILVVGNAHLLAPPAREALRALLGELAASPLIAVFIAETAPQGDRPWPESATAVEVDTPPLEPRDIDRMIRAIAAGREGEGALPDWLVELLVEHAAGSPGLAETNVRLLVQRGLVRAGGGHLALSRPEAEVEASLHRTPLARDLEEASTLRVSELPAADVWLMAAAALIGERFEAGAADVVGEALALSQELAWPGDLDARLAACRDAGLIEPEGEVFGAWRFAHESDRLRLLDRLAPRARTLANAVAARWLEGAPQDAGRSDGTRWERIARHWFDADRRDEGAKALAEAAACAHRGLSIDRARALYRKALIALGLGSQDGVSALLERAEAAAIVARGYARLCNATGDFPMSLPLHEAVLALSRVTRDTSAAAEALFGLGFAHRGLGRYPESRAALEAARDLYRELADADGLAGCLVQLARLDWIEGGPEQRQDAVRRCDEALGIRRRLGAPRPLAETLVSLANLHIQRGDHEAARTHLEEARARFRDLMDLAGEARCLVALGALAFYGHDALRAVDVWRDALALAERAGERELISALLNNLGEALVELGDHERAAVALGESLELAEDGGDPRIRADALKNLAALKARAGDGDAADDTLQEARAIAAPLGSPGMNAQLDRVEALILCLSPDSAHSHSRRARGVTVLEDVRARFAALGDTFEEARTSALLQEFQNA